MGLHKAANIGRKPRQQLPTMLNKAKGNRGEQKEENEMLKGKDEEEALDFANAAASIAVTREGAQASIPCVAEVKEKIG